MAEIKGKDLKKQWSNFIYAENEQDYYDLYTNYFHYLSFIGAKKGFSFNKVRDAINDLFLYLWENRNKLTDVRNHHNYIITAFLHKLYRKQNFDIDNCDQIAELPELLIAPSVEELYIRKNVQNDVSRILNDYVKMLPAKQRQMIYQKFYLGLSYVEISEANGISINTVYNTIYKAVYNLKILIGKDQMRVLVNVLLSLFIFFLYFLHKQ